MRIGWRKPVSASQIGNIRFKDMMGFPEGKELAHPATLWSAAQPSPVHMGPRLWSSYSMDDNLWHPIADLFPLPPSLDGGNVATGSVLSYGKSTMTWPCEYKKTSL